MFPKKLHFIWWQGQLPEIFQDRLEAWRLLNPKWEIQLWDKTSIQTFLAEEYPELRRAFQWIPKTRAKGVKFREIRKVDCARLLILHRLGGAYFDVDMVPHRPIDTFLEDREIRLRHFQRFEAVTLQDLSHKVAFLKPAGFRSIVFKDTRPMDAIGSAVINGAMFQNAHAKGETSWMLDFAMERLAWRHRRKPVLEAFGPYALAHFLRKRRELNMHMHDDIGFLPGHYVVWDDTVFGPRRWFVLCEHDGTTGAESWGNETLSEPWKQTR